MPAARNPSKSIEISSKMAQIGAKRGLIREVEVPLNDLPVQLV